MYTYYAKTKRQYRYLIKRLNKMLHSGEWENLSQLEQDKFRGRLKHLFHKLKSAFSGQSLVKAMGAAALIVGFSFQGNAQSFKSVVNNPFSLPNKGGVGIPSFVDIDGDGDLDLFDLSISPSSYQIQVDFKENIGSATAADFLSSTINPFGITTDSLSFRSTFGDLDNDGDYDMLRSTYYGNHLYYENTGSKTMPSFAMPNTNPFGLSGLNEITNSVFIDLDDDGDLDLMSGDYLGDFYYYENTGTNAAPQFGAPTKNPYGLANSSNYINICDFADIDGDGDLDLMYVEYYGDFAFAENTGSKTAPQFGTIQTNPFSLSNVGSYPSFMTFADLDGDSDEDIFVIEYYGNNRYYENNSGIGIDENELSSAMNVFPNPANEKVNITLDEDFGKATLEIVSTSGQLLKTKEVSNTLQIDMDVSDLSQGVYLVKLTADNRVGVTKLTIN